MVETLDRLMQHHGPKAKAIVWEHNTHIGDARFTDMARAGMVNVGQLVRQGTTPSDVQLVGFGTHRGTVIASDEWGAPMERMAVPRRKPGSFEETLFDAGVGDSLLLFDGSDDGAVNGLDEPMGRRAVLFGHFSQFAFCHLIKVPAVVSTIDRTLTIPKPVDQGLRWQRRQRFNVGSVSAARRGGPAIVPRSAIDLRTQRRYLAAAGFPGGHAQPLRGLHHAGDPGAVLVHSRVQTAVTAHGRGKIGPTGGHAG